MLVTTCFLDSLFFFEEIFLDSLRVIIFSFKFNLPASVLRNRSEVDELASAPGASLLMQSASHLFLYSFEG